LPFAVSDVVPDALHRPLDPMEPCAWGTAQRGDSRTCRRRHSERDGERWLEDRPPAHLPRSERCPRPPGPGHRVQPQL